MKKSFKQYSKECGQSTIEFLSTIVFTLAIFFVFVQLAYNATDGYLVHYATFMASRTFLVADTNSQSIEGSNSLALSLSKKTFETFKLSILGYDTSNIQFNLRTNVGGGLNPMYVGAYYSFKQPFSILPIVGGSYKLDLVSESFLGREPTKAECLERVCRALKDAGNSNGGGIGCGAGSSILTTFFDNGC